MRAAPSLVSFAVLWSLADPAWAQPPGEAAGNPGLFRPMAQGGPRLGEPAPSFTLQDLAGKTVRLRDLVGKRPIVIEFGSYT
jgi:hypothetical protein